MNETKEEWRAFKTLIGTAMDIYFKPMPQKETLHVWWAKLKPFEFSDICNAFDAYTNMPKTDQYAKPPMPNDIAKLCQSSVQRQLEHQVTIRARIPSPLAVAENKRRADEVVQNYPIKNTKTKMKDYKKWARDILDDPRSTDFQISFAKEALSKPTFSGDDNAS